MSKRGIFPGKISELNGYLRIVVPYITAHKIRLRIDKRDILAIADLHRQWKKVYQSWQSRNSRTRVISTALSGLRSDIERLLRKIYGDFPQSVLTINDRSTLDLKKRRKKRQKISAHKSIPAIFIDKYMPGYHTLRLTNPDTPDTRAVPKGYSMLLELYVGEAGLDKTKIPFNKSETVTRFLKRILYAFEDSGKTAYYRACYVSKRGEKGSWSVVKSGVIV